MRFLKIVAPGASDERARRRTVAGVSSGVASSSLALRACAGVMKCASPTLALTGLPSAVGAAAGSRVLAATPSDGPSDTLLLAPLALLGSVAGAALSRVRRGDRESLFDGSFDGGRSKLSFTPTVALSPSAIAAPFMPTAACCEGDGALAKKDVIGAAGFCGVAFLADIVDTIERLSLLSVCHLGTCTVSGRSCLLPRARSPCERPMANNAIASSFFELGGFDSSV